VQPVPPGPADSPRPPDLAAVLAELQLWIGANWDPELSLAAWRQRLADSGWACPDWPRDCCGLGLPAAVAAQVAATLAAARIPGPPEGVGVILAAPVIIEHGSEDLKRRLVRATATAELMWCQLFSEPGAGSDLAGLSTRAEPDGAGGWLVTGQKVWSTGAATADFGLLLARTDVDVPKHQGITAFALPMRQPGVQVRPLRQMNGHASFNEVFLDGARVPAGNVIGQPGDGWRVARATLARERRLATSAPRPGVDVPKGSFFPAHRYIDAAIMGFRGYRRGRGCGGGPGVAGGDRRADRRRRAAQVVPAARRPGRPCSPAPGRRWTA
jgi:alkylation response protein AidB-like acyl-CoA dehydrogenase